MRNSAIDLHTNEINKKSAEEPNKEPDKACDQEVEGDANEDPEGEEEEEMVQDEALEDRCLFCLRQ